MFLGDQMVKTHGAKTATYNIPMCGIQRCVCVAVKWYIRYSSACPRDQFSSILTLVLVHMFVPFEGEVIIPMSVTLLQNGMRLQHSISLLKEKREAWVCACWANCFDWRIMSTFLLRVKMKICLLFKVIHWSRLIASNLE